MDNVKNHVKHEPNIVLMLRQYVIALCKLTQNHGFTLVFISAFTLLLDSNAFFVPVFSFY